MVYGNSLMVIIQINKDWNCSTKSMGKYYATVWQVEDKFKRLEFHDVERDRNMVADVLSKLDSSRASTPLNVFVQEIRLPSIPQDSSEECNTMKDVVPLTGLD
jgi:hypothetical protein